MAVNEVYMDIPAVRGMAKKFGDIGQVLTGVNKVLETLSTTLKAVATPALSIHVGPEELNGAGRNPARLVP